MPPNIKHICMYIFIYMYIYVPIYTQTNGDSCLGEQVSVWEDEPYARIWKGRARLDDHELRSRISFSASLEPTYELKIHLL